MSNTNLREFSEGAPSKTQGVSSSPDLNHCHSDLIILSPALHWPVISCLLRQFLYKKTNLKQCGYRSEETCAFQASYSFLSHFCYAILETWLPFLCFQKASGQNPETGLPKQVTHIWMNTEYCKVERGFLRGHVEIRQRTVALNWRRVELD